MFNHKIEIKITIIHMEKTNAHNFLNIKFILTKKSHINATQLYKLSFIQLLQITINKKETDDDQLKDKKRNKKNKTCSSSAV